MVVRWLVAQVLLLASVCVSQSGAVADEIWHVIKPRRVAETNGTGAEETLAKILSDSSFQASLPAPTASEVVAHFQCTNATTIRRIRVEILPDARFQDGRLGRNPERKELMVFGIEARLAKKDAIAQRIEWQSCRISIDADDPDNTDGSNLIDAASDTGWSIPRNATADAWPTVILTFSEDVRVSAGGSFTLSFDVGGHPSIDTPARYRVAFAGR